MNAIEEKASMAFWAITQKQDARNKDKFWNKNYYQSKMLEEFQ